MLDAVAAHSEDERLVLEEEYLELFVLGRTQPRCPLYESGYLDPTGRDRGLIATEVERAYAAAGAVFARDDELPDHLAFELEFLSLLCGHEAAAWRGRRRARALELVERERSFLDEHLLRWLPALAAKVERQTSETSFYRRLANAVHAFVVHDRDLIGVLASPAAPAAVPSA